MGNDEYSYKSRIIRSTMCSGKLLLAIAFVSSVVFAAEEGLVRKKLHRQRVTEAADNVMDDEDLAFWTRLLRDDRDLGSMPIASRPSSARPPSPTPPSPVPDPTRRPTRNPTKQPTRNPTKRPTRRPTSPTPPTPPIAPAFNCPAASSVGCTAPDPSKPTDECPAIGEPCVGGNEGEFCCRDACPRNFCTAKEGRFRKRQ